MPCKNLKNRKEAGEMLAARLQAYAGRDDVIVLALPRGGVPVAYEVARALAAPLDFLVVRKLGLPGQEEYAIGAIASGGERVLNEAAVRRFHIPAEAVEAVEHRETAELERREQRYRAGRPPPQLAGRIVILVDDGLATGATMQAAAKAVRRQDPARVVVAVPVGAEATCSRMERFADEVVCCWMPQPFYGVGQWYEDFSETGDEEVQALLASGATASSETGKSKTP